MFRRALVSGRLLALLVPLAVVAACGSDDPRTPTTLAPPINTLIASAVGLQVPTVPTVMLADQKGRALSGVWVHWVVTSGGGKVVNDSAQTNASGVASSGGWTLGRMVGEQTLTASAAALPTVTFTAQAVAGPVTSLIQWSPVSSAMVNTVLPTPPAVKAFDAFGNPVAGVQVTFAVVLGGGTVSGPQQSTGVDGIATATGWTLGSLAGDQKVLATAAATGTATTIAAKGLAAAPAQIALIEGNLQTGSVGHRLCQSPSVLVTDAFGNPAAQIPVVFTPTTGSGTVTSGVVLTDTAGIARVGAWNLGNDPQQTLMASTASVAGKSITFTATTAPPPGFGMCARFIGTGGTPRQREAVAKALVRWQSIIVGHVQTTHLVAPAAACASDVPTPAIDEDVEDLLLFVQLAPIDGPSNIIGRAAPCYIHLPAGLTLMGFLQLDTADLDLMLTQGLLDNVVLHEIGHILGIGTLWNYRRSLLTGAGGSDPFFAGAVARDQFALTGSLYAGTPVPVENSGGAGTRDSHWRRSVFGTELMQGYSAPNMPLSKVTIGSLADLGYTVNLNAADPFSLLPSLRAAAEVTGPELVNDLMDVKLVGVEKGGAQVLLRVPSSSIRK